MRIACKRRLELPTKADLDLMCSFLFIFIGGSELLLFLQPACIRTGSVRLCEFALLLILVRILFAMRRRIIIITN